MTRKGVQKEVEGRPQVCEECGVRRPYHAASCSKVRGLHCPECGARHPRHYPRCSQDVLGMGGWNSPMSAQRDLEEQYKVEWSAAGHEGRSTQPPALARERPAPRNNAPFNRQIGAYLWRRITGLRDVKDRKIRQMMAEVIHEDIDRLAESRDLEKFVAEVKP